MNHKKAIGIAISETILVAIIVGFVYIAYGFTNPNLDIMVIITAIVATFLIEFLIAFKFHR